MASHPKATTLGGILNFHRLYEYILLSLDRPSKLSKRRKPPSFEAAQIWYPNPPLECTPVQLGEEALGVVFPHALANFF